MIKNNNNLAAIARSNAYIRLKEFSKDHDFKRLGSELSKEIRDWLITGEGEPHAPVDMCDIALALTCVDIKELSLEDSRIYLEYLLCK